MVNGCHTIFLKYLFANFIIYQKKKRKKNKKIAFINQLTILMNQIACASNYEKHIF